MKEQIKPKEKFVEWSECPNCKKVSANTNPGHTDIYVRCGCGHVYEYHYKTKPTEKQVVDIVVSEVKND